MHKYRRCSVAVRIDVQVSRVGTPRAGSGMAIDFGQPVRLSGDEVDTVRDVIDELIPTCGAEVVRGPALTGSASESHEFRCYPLGSRESVVVRLVGMFRDVLPERFMVPLCGHEFGRRPNGERAEVFADLDEPQ